MSKLYDSLSSASPSPNADESRQMNLFGGPQNSPLPNHLPQNSSSESSRRKMEFASFNTSSVPRGVFSNVLTPLSGPRGMSWRWVSWTAVAAALVAIFAVAGGGWWLFHRWSAKTKIISDIVSRPEQASLPIPSPPMPPMETRPQTPSYVRAPPPPPPAAPTTPPAKLVITEFPTFKITGAEVTHVGNVQIVKFREGIFSGGTRIRNAAHRSLSELAQQLKPYGQRVAVLIVGCTDNTPLDPSSRFQSNQELGLARAKEVAKVLQQMANLPPNVFTIASYGERWAPYPNDTPENKARNRTVVIRVSLKD